MYIGVYVSIRSIEYNLQLSCWLIMVLMAILQWGNIKGEVTKGECSRRHKDKGKERENYYEEEKWRLSTRTRRQQFQKRVVEKINYRCNPSSALCALVPPTAIKNSVTVYISWDIGVPRRNTFFCTLSRLASFTRETNTRDKERDFYVENFSAGKSKCALHAGYCCIVSPWMFLCTYRVGLYSA